MWQMRHKRVGLFMGVAHGNAHYSNISECCRSLGVFQFNNRSQIESALEMADSPHLPEESRLTRDGFVIEPWSQNDHNLLEAEGLEQDCSAFTTWVFSVFPQGVS